MPRIPKINQIKRKVRPKQVSGYFFLFLYVELMAGVPSGPSVKTSGNRRGRSDKARVGPRF